MNQCVLPTMIHVGCEHVTLYYRYPVHDYVLCSPHCAKSATLKPSYILLACTYFLNLVHSASCRVILVALCPLAAQSMASCNNDNNNNNLFQVLISQE